MNIRNQWVVTDVDLPGPARLVGARVRGCASVSVEGEGVYVP